MSYRPIHIDWFCCEGGGSEGFTRAGFDVVGVDLFKHTDPRTGKRVGFSRKRYPFPAWQGDALEGLDILLRGDALPFTDLAGNCRWIYANDVASHSASCPCQHASAGTRAMRANGDDRHPALIEPTRERLQALGKPWVIENVSGAALRDPIMLCGSMFGLTANDEDGFPLRLERHRLFESNIPLTAPGPCEHDETVWAGGVYGGARGRKPEWTAAEHRHSARYDRHGGYVPASITVQQELLGIDWMTKGGMAQSLPPIYCQHVGLQIAAHLAQERAA